jgi:hypothetical protein
MKPQSLALFGILIIYPEHYSTRLIDNIKMREMAKAKYPGTKILLRYDRIQ